MIFVDLVRFHRNPSKQGITLSQKGMSRNNHPVDNGMSSPFPSLENTLDYSIGGASSIASDIGGPPVAGTVRTPLLKVNFHGTRVSSGT